MLLVASIFVYPHLILSFWIYTGNSRTVLAGKFLNPTLLVQSSSRGSDHELIFSGYIIGCRAAVLHNDMSDSKKNFHLHLQFLIILQLVSHRHHVNTLWSILFVQSIDSWYVHSITQIYCFLIISGSFIFYFKSWCQCAPRARLLWFHRDSVDW